MAETIPQWQAMQWLEQLVQPKATMPRHPAEDSYATDPAWAEAARTLGVPIPEWPMQTRMASAYRYLQQQLPGDTVPVHASPLEMLRTLHGASPALLRQALLSAILERYNTGNVSAAMKDLQGPIAGGTALFLQEAFPQVVRDDPSALLRALLSYTQDASPSGTNPSLLGLLPSFLRGGTDVPSPPPGM